MGRILPQGACVGPVFRHPGSRELYLVGFEVTLFIVLGGCNSRYWYHSMDPSFHVTNQLEHIQVCGHERLVGKRGP